jgi:hypothetical protein
MWPKMDLSLISHILLLTGYIFQQFVILITLTCAFVFIVRFDRAFCKFVFGVHIYIISFKSTGLGQSCGFETDDVNMHTENELAKRTIKTRSNLSPYSFIWKTHTLKINIENPHKNAD